MARANIFGRHHFARTGLDLSRGHATSIRRNFRWRFTVAGGSLQLSVAGCIPEVEKCDFVNLG